MRSNFHDLDRQNHSDDYENVVLERVLYYYGYRECTFIIEQQENQNEDNYYSLTKVSLSDYGAYPNPSEYLISDYLNFESQESAISEAQFLIDFLLNNSYRFKVKDSVILLCIAPKEQDYLIFNNYLEQNKAGYGNNLGTMKLKRIT